MENNKLPTDTVMRKKRLYRYLKIGALTFGLITVALIATYSIFLANKVVSVTSEASQALERGEKSQRRLEPVTPKSDNISILVLGTDQRNKNERARTDALIVATFNKSDNSIKMVSIPRDAYVEIEGRRSKDKINHAHAFGGIDLTVSTVENFLEIPIDYYVSLNFNAFMEIIDALGGVEIDVPFTFTEIDSNDRQGMITLYEGTQRLDGEQALAYARMRRYDPTGDIGRGLRQQEIIRAVINEAASFSSITRYGDVLDGIGNNIKMNLSFQNILALHSYVNSLNSIETLTLEGVGERINGIYYHIINEASLKSVSQQLNSHLNLTRHYATKGGNEESEYPSQ